MYPFIKKLTRFKLQLTLGILLSFTLALSSIALLTLSGWFISAAAFAGLTAATVGNFNYFIPASTIRFLALLRILSRYFDRVVNHDYTFKILTELRVWFYQKLIPLAPAHLLSHQSGDLLNRAVNDIDTLDHLYLNVLSPILITLFLIVLLTVFIAHFSLTLAMTTLSVLLFSVIFISAITLSFSHPIGHNIQSATALLRTQIIDFLQGFTDVLLFIKKENRLTLIKKTHQHLMQSQKKLANLKGFSLATMQLFSGLSVFLILFLGVSLVRNKTIDGAELAMIVFLVVAAFEQLTALPLAFLAWGKTQSAATRIHAITNEKPAVVFPLHSKTKDHAQFDIAFNDVSFSYPDRPTSVLTNFNVVIKTGQHIGITGPSGAGKTTMAYLIARIWDPTQGEITIGENNIKNFSEADLRKNISLVTQHVHIFNSSVRDNMTLSQAQFSDENCYAVLEKLELAHLIHQLPDGLNTLMGEFGKHFSGGQIRRIAIARALLHNTPIVILDEPSTGLEDDLVKRIWRNCELDFKDKTIIVITHDKKLLCNMDECIHLS